VTSSSPASAGRIRTLPGEGVRTDKGWMESSRGHPEKEGKKPILTQGSKVMGDDEKWTGLV